MSSSMATSQYRRMKTRMPVTRSNAPITRLFPAPKYVVKAPMARLTKPKKSKNIPKNICHISTILVPLFWFSYDS